VRTDSSIQAVKSKVSGIIFPVLANASLDVLHSILWTQSAVDIADAVLTAVASSAIMLFEGSPGRGKTAVAYGILGALGMQCTRINLSPTTSAEDLFGRYIPQCTQEGGFATRFADGPLTVAMNRSCNDSIDQPLPSQAILLDEINLASPQLLERLEGFMLHMVSRSSAGKGRYLLPNGKGVDHHAIVIVTIMNRAALSNARSALSAKLQDVSHFLRLAPFNRIEL
jgi:midasin (ATPase involved in ribosome maturation)